VQNYQIRNLEYRDIKPISKLHPRAFSSDHFTSHFSINMLERYFELLNSDNKFNYVIFDKAESTLLGYLIAENNIPSVLKKFIKSNFLNVFSVLLKNPKFIIEKIFGFIRNYFLPKRSQASFRVHIFVTNPDFQRRGIGKLLLQKLEEDLRNYGLKYYGLSVRENNIGAINFYKTNSFKIEFVLSKSIYFIKYL